MRYSLIRETDISNGEGVGVALFVQGCHFHCPGCFNQETWDFAGGKEWTPDIEEKFLQLINRPYIKRVSILGGEPLADENVETVISLIDKIKEEYPDIQVWVYTGYTYNDILYGLDYARRPVLVSADVLVAGPFDITKQDLTGKYIKWAGSTNQKVIDVQRSMEEGKIVPYKAMDILKKGTK